MRKNALLTAILAFCLLHSYSQNPKLDSLKWEYDHLPHDSIHSRTHLILVRNLGIKWSLENPDSSARFFDEYFEVAAARNDIEALSTIYRNLALNHKSNGQLERALKTYQDLWILLKKNDKESTTVPLLGDIASLYYDAGYFHAAKAYLRAQIQAAKIYEARPNIWFGTLSNLGFTFMELAKLDSANYDSAHHYFSLALLAASKADESIPLIAGMDYIGELELQRGNPEQAESYFRKGLALIKQCHPGDPQSRGILLFEGRAYYWLASTYLAKNEPDSVFHLAKKANQTWDQLELNRQEVKRVDLELFQAKAYELKGKFALAEQTFQVALKSADKLPQRRLEKLSLIQENLSEYYLRQQKYQKAIQARDQRDALELVIQKDQDKWFFFSNHSSLVSSVLELELEQEHEQLVQEGKIKNLSIAIVVVVCVLLGFVLFLFYNLRKSNLLNKENARQLEELNKSKDTLMSLLAHDLRTPFQSVLGLSERAQEQIKEQNWEKVKKSVRVIGESSQEAYYLFENLLGWAKSQSGKLNFQPEIVNLKPVIKDTLRILEASTESKNIECVISSGNYWVNADPFMLRCIVRNLLSNAIKFSPYEARIEIMISEVEHTWKISIKDEGNGISPKKIQELQSGSSSVKGNNGLGLVLCRDFISHHGCELSIESTVGEGATFSFCLPKSEIAPMTVIPEETSPETNKQQNIGQPADPDLIKELRQLKIYQSSKVRQLLDSIDDTHSLDLVRWKEQFNLAVEQFNEAEFAQLLSKLPGPESQPLENPIGK